MSTTEYKTIPNPDHNPISILRRELWNVIRSEITPFETSPALEKYFETFINKGAGTVRLEPLMVEMTRDLEAKQNLAILIQSMKRSAGRGRYILDIPDLEASLRSLCPLFPFC
jgi:hypothetical protein